ncbi:MAG TPA: hypothetical protein VNA88_15405 [Candidatus Kapabacteria bacterium]|nr:hypothetical protein [Candidatus Kapabacteria bacterium]
MQRFIHSFLVISLSALVALGCGGDTAVDPPDNDDDANQASTIEFTIAGQSYTLDVLPAAYSSSTTGKTAISGSTLPGVTPFQGISLAFKLMGAGSVRMDNTGNTVTDDGFEIVIGDRTFRTFYYECVNGNSELAYTEPGTVTIESANPTTRRIRGTFTGQLASLVPIKVMCGSFEYDKYELYTVTGRFTSDWMTI